MRCESRSDSPFKISGKESALRFSGVVEELRQAEIRIARAKVFGLDLVEVCVAEVAKDRVEPPQAPGQRELYAAQVGDNAEVHAPGKGETVFRLRLHFRERVSD